MIFNYQPIPIVKVKFDRILSNEEKDFLFSCPMRYMEMNNNYFSEDYFILNNKILNSLKLEIQKILNQYQQDILGIKQDLKITQSWVAKTIKGGWHSTHNHPNSMFSCVMYLQTPSYSSINFECKNSIFKGFNFNFDYIKPTEYNQNYFKMNVNDMDLIIFPSWINHSVDVNTSDMERIVLGVNSFVFGEFGENSFYPVQLKLQ